MEYEYSRSSGDIADKGMPNGRMGVVVAEFEVEPIQKHSTVKGK
jgi:hypothetical protein